MDKYLLTPIAKVLFAQEYHADEKEWIDCEWNASSEKTRWLLTERAKAPRKAALMEIINSGKLEPKPKIKMPTVASLTPN